MTFQPQYRPSGRSVWFGKDLVETDELDRPVVAGDT